MITTKITDEDINVSIIIATSSFALGIINNEANKHTTTHTLTLASKQPAIAVEPSSHTAMERIQSLAPEKTHA